MRRGIIVPKLARSMQGTNQSLAAFVRANRGATSVEFAFVALPFLMLLAGIMVIGFMMFCASTLDYATQRSARQVMVGTVVAGNLSADQFRTTVVCRYLPSPLFDCTKVVVNLTAVQATGEPTAFTNFVKPDYSGLVIPPLDNKKTSYCNGSGGTYQILEVLYPLPVYMSIFSSSPHVVDNQFILMSTATFKNEPFQGSSTTSTGC